MKELLVEKEYVFSNNDEYIIKSESSELTLVISKNSHVKLVLMDIQAKTINIKLEEYSKLDCDMCDFNTKERIRNINLEENSYFNLKTIQAFKIVEKTLVNLNGYNAEFISNYLSVTKGFESKIETFVNHNARSTISDVKNYGITLENSGIIFDTTGKIVKGMEKSLCRQLTKGVISDNSSYIKALPILLIDEYDVKANHGASIGKMSDEELFYLMSRGLSRQDAFKLILSGIINPFLDSLLDESLHDKIQESIYRLI